MVRTPDSMLRQLCDTGVYLVTEDAVPSEVRLRKVASALDAGVRVVQLRDKHTSKRALVDEARRMRALCHERDAVFLVNDDVALAWAVDADGVHLGQDDLPVQEARRLLGSGRLIGLSISALEEAVQAEREGVDYIGVGAIYATPTKTDAELGGLDLLREVRERVKKPLVAIGGIDAGNAQAVLAAGADSMAVVRAVLAQEDVAGAARRLLEIARLHKAGER